jgi:hypothetical protein
MLTAVSNAKQYAWGDWILGIFRAFISGGSAAMVAGFSSMGIAPDKFNLTTGIGKTFLLMGVMFLFMGLFRMFEFLQLHGAPEQLQATLAGAAVASQTASDAIAQAQSQAPDVKP